MTTQTHDMTDLQRTLCEQLGAHCVSIDEGVLDAHANDWSDAEKRRPQLVVMPRTPDEVARALGVLSKLGQKVVVQGGLTGLATATYTSCRVRMPARRRCTRSSNSSMKRCGAPVDAFPRSTASAWSSRNFCI